MNEETTVLLDIDFNNLIGSLQKLSKEYAKNADELKKMKEQDKQTSEEYVKMQQTQKVLAQEIRGVEKAIQQEIKVQNANKGSLVAMRAELSNLNKQYDSMSGMERMGEQGQALQKTIADLTAEIQGLEGATGRWQRNVGNYKSALGDLKNGFSAAGLSTKGLDSALKLLNKNPVITILGIIGTLLVSLSAKLKNTEQLTASLTKTTKTLQPVMDMLAKIVSKLADVFSNVLDWAIEKTIDALGWLGRQIQKVGALFGKDWGSGLVDFSYKMQEARKATEETAEATDILDTSLSKANETLNQTRETLEDFLTAYKKVIADIKKESLAEALQKAGGTKTAAEVIDEMREGYEKLETTLDEMPKELPESLSPSAFEKFAFKIRENAKNVETTISGLSSSFGSLGDIYEQMAKDETKSEEERANAAKQAKTWAALQIAANSGTAIAKGVASAMDTPFPANLGALVTTMAAVLSAIAQAKQLAKQTFETGGVIGGFHGATMGHDNTTASVRTGEMILNANQQKELFKLANGGGSTSLAASLAAALSAMPAPVVDYQEFTRFTSRVAALDENAKLK